jgi:hypothetical protein
MHLHKLQPQGQIAHNLLATNQGKEHVEGNLDAVQEEQSVLVRDDSEVDGMDDWPDLPGSLTCGEKVVLDLLSDGSKRITVDQTKVGEEDGHKDWTPNNLVEQNLEGDRLGILSWYLLVKPVVEVVTGWTVVEETKGRKSEESLPVEYTICTTNENLIMEYESLGSQSIFKKRII